MIWDGLVDAIVRSDIFLIIFKVIMGVVMTIVNIVLYPIGLLIKHTMPALDTGLLYIKQLFEYSYEGLVYLIDLFHIPSLAIIIISGYFISAFTITFGIWTVKLVIKWKKALW